METPNTETNNTINPNMTTCKHCGHIVAKNAKTCPSCGGKLKKNLGCLIGCSVPVVLALVLIIVLFSMCSIPETKATVTDKNGNTVYMTNKEIIEAGENDAKFNSLYLGADISFVGTVKEIKTNCTNITVSSTAGDYIEFEEGFEVFLPLDYYEDFLVTVNKGDRIKVSSEISIVFGSTIYVGDPDTITTLTLVG